MNSQKKILLYSLSIIGIILLVTAGASLLFEKKISALVNQKVSQMLRVPLSFDNSNLSFIRAFPYASLEYENILIHSLPIQQPNDTLLWASSLRIKLNLLSLLSGKSIIQKINIEKARVFLFTDKAGKNNFDVFKSDTTVSDNRFELQLRSLAYSELDIQYIHLQNQISAIGSQASGELQGNFSEHLKNLHLSSKAHITNFDSDKLRYIDNKDVALELDLQVNNEQNSIHIPKGHLQLEGMRLSVNGKINGEEKGKQFDLTLQSEQADLKALLSIMPFLSTEKINRFNYQGNLDFHAEIKGLQNEKLKPGIEVQFSGKKIQVKPKNGGAELKNIQFTGKYNNGHGLKTKKEIISIENFNASLAGQSIKGSFVLEQFDNPLIRSRLQWEGKLQDIGPFVLPDTVENVLGNLKINASIQGRVALPGSLKGSGSIQLSDGSFKLRNNPLEYKQFSFNGVFDANRLQINDLQIQFGESNLTAMASIENIWAYLFKENENMLIKGQISSSVLHLDDVLPEESNNTVNNTKESRFELNPNLKLNLSVSIQSFAFRAFQANQINGDIHLVNQVLHTDNLQFETAGGSISLSSTIDARETDSLNIIYHAKAKSLNITNLFEEMGNFGQEVITSNNVKGSVSVEMDLYSRWHKDLTCDMNSIVSISQFTIVNGELNNFAPILPLSKYIRGAGFDRIQFSTLTNTIEIKNRLIYIPAMEIKSSALDITASGTHSFDNMVDYKLRLYLSDLLGKKVRQMNTEFGTIEPDNTGRSSLHILMTGPVNNPKFKWDRKSVEKKIEQSVKEGTKNFKELIQQEFGKNREDSIPDKAKETKKDKKQELQLDFD